MACGRNISRFIPKSFDWSKSSRIDLNMFDKNICVIIWEYNKYNNAQMLLFFRSRKKDYYYVMIDGKKIIPQPIESL